MKILLISGEISSDRYAAHLAKAIKAKNPSVILYGIGGKQTAKVVDHFLMDIADENVIGILEVAQKRAFFKNFLLQLESFLLSTPVDRVVMLDFPHRNFQLAALFKSFHLPIYTFITPNFWIWKDKKQAQKLVTYSKHVITIFDREYQLYRQLGRNVHYFGHPLVEIVPPSLPKPLQKPYVIGLLPGSRKQEIGYHLPVMLQTIKLAQEKSSQSFKVMIKVSSPAFKPEVEKYVKKYNIDVTYSNESLETFLSQVNVMMTVAGTVTLEGVIRNVPQVIIGRFAHLTYLIAKYILRIQLPLIGLPNIIMGKKVVPEFKQFEMIPEKIAESLLEQLDPSVRKITFDRYAALRHALTVQEKGSVYAQTAALILRP